MIYLDNPLENTREFENLLQLVKLSTLKKLSKLPSPSSLSGEEFKALVYEVFRSSVAGTSFEDKILHTTDREFPDIVAAGYYGVEVKATKKDDWTSVGNSVLESSRVPQVEKIYMFFGKLGGEPAIIYKDYASCLKSISVTHYPRYMIDMNLANDQSIFSKMGVDYDAMRSSSNPVKDIRKYYRSQLKEGESLWWIDDDLDVTATTGPVIRNLSSLPTSQRDLIKADIFVRFPSVFAGGSKKYEDIPAYLASRYGVVTSNLRDHFTAGGQVELECKGEKIKVPQIFSEAKRLIGLIHDNLSDKNEDYLTNAWHKKIDNFDTPLKAWLKEIDNRTANLNLDLPASEILASSSRQ